MAAEPGGWLGPALGLRLLLATALQMVSAFGAEFSSESCRELGFSSNLLCGSCDLLGQFDLLSWTPTVEGAVRKKHSLKPRSCMQELSSKSADESWGGSRKSSFRQE